MAGVAVKVTAALAGLVWLATWFGDEDVWADLRASTHRLVGSGEAYRALVHWRGVAAEQVIEAANGLIRLLEPDEAAAPAAGPDHSDPRPGLATPEVKRLACRIVDQENLCPDRPQDIREIYQGIGERFGPDAVAKVSETVEEFRSRSPFSHVQRKEAPLARQVHARRGRAKPRAVEFAPTPDVPIDEWMDEAVSAGGAAARRRPAGRRKKSRMSIDEAEAIAERIVMAYQDGDREQVDEMYEWARSRFGENAETLINEHLTKVSWKSRPAAGALRC